MSLDTWKGYVKARVWVKMKMVEIEHVPSAAW